MYELVYTKRFKFEISKFKSYEHIIAKHLGILMINPTSSIFKTNISKEKDVYGNYESKISKDFSLFWRYGRDQKIYLTGIIKK